MDYFCWLLKKDVVTLEEKGSPEALARAAELKGRLEKTADEGLPEVVWR